MKYVKSYNSEAVLTINGKRQFCKIVTDEYKTMYKITSKADGHALPFAIEWKYKKNKYKDEIQAVTAFFADVEKTYK